jgi:PAS domain S-box-containing protein
MDSVLENLPDGFFTLDADWRFTAANARFLHLTGRTRDELIGRSLGDVLPELRGSAIEATLRRAVAEGVSVEADHRWGGRDLHVRVRAHPGDGGGLVVFCQDLAATHPTWLANDESYRTLVELAPQFIWLLTPEGHAEFANESWTRYSGMDVTRRDQWGDVVHPDDHERTLGTWRSASAEGRAYSLEYRLRRASDGEYRWHLARVTPHRDAGGRIVQWVAVATDIHEQKLAEEALRRARGEADAANAAKDRFLAVLSHELRTPLTPVLIAVSAMEADPNIPDYVREDLLTVRRNIDLETRLIDDLLDLSRVTSGKLRLNPEPIAVHQLLRHVLEICAADMLAKRLQLVFDLRASEDHIVADPARLQQVFWNLLKNAIKFTPEQGRVAIRTRNCEPGRIEVEVKDSGTGIAPDVLPRIFDAFEQGDPTVTRQFGGLGLGLAISKAIVDMHGGAIRAESGGHRRGATFTVRLDTAVTAAAPRPVHAGPGGVLKPVSSRVLLVEDHRDTANVLAKLLARQGYRVRIAHTVASALEIAAAEEFDVVVSDIGLPDATGYELMQQLRDRYGAKGIALSGFGMEEDMQKSREAGFLDHVVKPVDAAQLEAVLRRVTTENEAR